MHDGFDIYLAKTGASVTVESGVSILDTLLSKGYDIDYMCAEGVCGSCSVQVISGRVDHKDMVLTGEERESGLMQVCVSIPEQGEKLVLDL